MSISFFGWCYGWASVAPFVRILKKDGAERVSRAAAEYFAEAIEDLALEIAKEAVDLAKHGKEKNSKSRRRKTSFEEISLFTLFVLF